ncbi:unnamed protein product [Clonostachys byssicola]|uniref:SRR1-like domain-containing protein n=1 Tax=Clonostachys byssicola TaxID=160290 RepID=A0A9N9UEP0_9HYPO|nr:unnamed protein product [Clonostachys byssicola]
MSEAVTLALTLDDLQAEADRRNNPVLTPLMEEDIAYIEALYNSGAKLWTKEMFVSVEAELSKQPLPQFVELRSMNGNVRQKRLPRAPSVSPQRPGGGSMGRPLPFIRYFLYQDLKAIVSEEEHDHNLGEAVATLSDEIRRTLATRAMSISLISYAPTSIDYDRIRGEWDAVVNHRWPLSHTCAEITKVLAEQAAISKNINKIVCFGLGSLGWSIEIEDERYEPADRVYSAIVQHAAALTIAKVIGKRLDVGGLTVFCQDPIYSAADKRVLAEAGIQVVGGRGGLAFTYIDENTVVISCHPNIPVKQVVADLGKPAILICNEVKEEGEEKWRVFERHGNFGLLSPYPTDHDSPRTREMVKGYHRFPFPQDRLGFGDIQIYVRKDPINEASSSVAHETVKDVTGEAAKDLSGESSKGIAGGVPTDANFEAPEEATDKPSKGITIKNSRSITDEGSKDSARETPQGVADEAFEYATGDTPNNVYGVIFKNINWKASKSITDETATDAEAEAPKGVTGDISKDVIGKACKDSSG